VLARRLYRRTPAELAGALGRDLLVRVGAAACAWGSMVLIAWIAAFARAVLGQGWSGFRTLDAVALANASMEAGRYEAGLVAVLAVWAAWLLGTPTGYTTAFRGAAVAAAALGALDFAPPSFLVTSKVAGLARGLAQITRSWNGIALLIVSVAAAYLLQRGALAVFGQLDQFSAVRGQRPTRTARFLLVAVVLLLATWSGAVVWLAGHPHGDAAAAGARAGLALSGCLPALAVVAVLVTTSDKAHKWLLPVASSAAVLGAVVADAWPLPRDLTVSFGRGDLERMGTALGGDGLWVALFACVPACLLAAYLMAPVRPVRGARF